MRIAISFAIALFISVAACQQALQYSSTGNIVKNANDLKTVFTQGYLDSLKIGSLTYNFSPVSRLTLSNIVFTQKSFDSSSEDVKFNTTTKTLSYKNANDEFTFTFTFVYSGWFISTRQGTGVGSLKLKNLGFDKVITQNQGKITFDLQNPTLEISQYSATSITPSYGDIFGYINKNVLTETNFQFTQTAFTNSFVSNAKTLFQKEQPSASNTLVIKQNSTGKAESMTFNSTLTNYTLTTKEEIKYFDFSVFNLPNQEVVNVSTTVNASYGDLQTVYSISVLQNIFSYAVKNSYLNSELNSQNWNIPSFQFFVGDLSYIMPSVSNDYYADTKLNGSCSSSANTTIQVLPPFNLVPHFYKRNHWRCHLQLLIVRGKRQFQIGRFCFPYYCYC